jgi:hypothetical protein
MGKTKQETDGADNRFTVRDAFRAVNGGAPRRRIHEYIQPGLSAHARLA